MPETPAVDIRNLCKTYKKTRRQEAKKALDNVTLEIPQGAMFALLGPNGAGKSTLINILAGLVIKSSGDAAVCGYDIEKDMRAARRAIGVVPQELNLDPFFTPRELLDLQAGLYGVPRAQRRTDEILAAVGLTDRAGAYARALSGGMRRRLLVGKAMVHSPPVLVLDEPTAGVDVELRHHLWEYVTQMNKKGVTVLLTTHYLEEAEALCDTIAIINHGRLIACEDKKTLLKRLDHKEIVIDLAQAFGGELPAALAALGGETAGPRALVFRYAPSSAGAAEIIAAVNAAGLEITDVTTHETELEDIFISLTQEDSGRAA